MELKPDKSAYFHQSLPVFSLGFLCVGEPIPRHIHENQFCPVFSIYMAIFVPVFECNDQACLGGVVVAMSAVYCTS